ncbi:sugar-binding transcriptional regulator [Roseibium sp. M-1]
MPAEKREDDEAFLCEVCWHYFVNELTQADVARLLGVTRLRVNQAISQAKATGIVRIEITSPFLARHELQEALQRRFGLTGASVVPANRAEYDAHIAVGAALASYMVERLKEDSWNSVGVSWGATLQNAILKLPKMELPELDIISMIGGTTTGSSFNAFSVASGFAEKLGANYSLFAAPLYLSERSDVQNFFAQEVFEDHLTKLERLDAAILVAGDVSSRSYLVSSALPSDVSIADLEACGAVGDVLGRFLDKDGNVVEHNLNQRTVGLDLDDLKKVPEIILAAAGPYKVPIIRAAIRRGIVNTLITDDVTAELLLKETP